MANPALLDLQALTVARGNTVLARDMTRRLAPGDLWLLTGPNGSGKTSVLRALAGLLEPQSGTRTPGCDFHFLGAQPLDPSLETPRQYLAYQAALIGGDTAPSYDPFGIAPYLDIALNRLSTGWRQRVKLTRLMLAPRPLWLLDEPSTGLDAAGEAVLQALIRAHAGAGNAAVIATHDAHLWPDAPATAFGGAA